MEPIYLDHAATTPVHPEVVKEMIPVLEHTFGNPSSVHHFGRQARKILDESRQVIAESIGANEKEIVYTSGGTEADNMALIGVARKRQNEGKHIITTSIEHHATLRTAEYLEKEGFEVTYLPVDETGRISVEDVKNHLREDTILVSIMYVNNEVGTIQPVQEIGELLKEHSAYFHTDAVQAFGTLPIDVNELGVDLLSVSAHKIYGPKGIGFLYVREGIMLQALQHGGEQERKRRAGTENTAAVKGFQKAVELIGQERKARNHKYSAFKKHFLQTLEEQEVNFSINGDEQNSVSSIVNISFPGTNVESLLTNFDLSGIAASSGSACTAGSVEPSHVLSEMYSSRDERTTNSIRFSFGNANDEEQMGRSAKKVAKIVHRLT
ncbi:cysteine desulfurase [Salinibacillus kushneri]|uniref:cysteine desulfurase n=1 Tax=Salinibacillus kushneri TaxID=237682 RepID=A0A1I0G745_9BACI|nr:cysteine desulfurase family protein [Salinibacillus kushneri]SET66436.1 cysteine desulfurase [Salinibacillus kushneri]